ncbi:MULTISPECIES: methylated-DNA--[protein]-cysteine S-methyltransferase [unclassified Zymobacter]|uniref:methylated-DNA--[protein]-cysteine S-methyltransferase n=1 Tax=unclassified Zymobacter TaxID=3048685 RepID=UPI0039C35A99
MRTHLDITTPLGDMRLIAEDDQLYRIVLSTAHVPDDTFGTAANTPVLCETAKQMEEWLLGQRTHFELPLAPFGTPFQQAVRDAMLAIPYGRTCHYGGIAQQVGSPRAARAVGLACRNNPLPIIVPCHRVLAADGGLVGYNGGLDIKRHLLALEARIMKATTP